MTASRPSLLERCRQLIGHTLDATASPLGNWLHGTLLTVDADSCTVTYVVRPEMTNPAGILHGGIMAAMLDELIGMTVHLEAGDTFFASVNLAVDYLAAARIGDEVIARTRIVRRGKRIVNVEGTLALADGTLLARATSNLAATPRFSMSAGPSAEES
jgi:uncharacterized protein (TIGR00369 family)